MAKDKSLFTCSDCGGTTPKWLGQCPNCQAWNTLVETAAPAAGAGKNRFEALARSAPVARLADIEAQDVQRTPTGQDELDRALGGGIVPGGVVLIGGDPGIGK
ncbi:MAG: DNA repair protein RadA, partial [Betaproteobacteria bacterium]